MSAIHDATKEGTRGYIMDLISEEEKLRAEHGAGDYTFFSITAFDTVFDQWLIDTPVSQVNVDQVIERYQPRGMTALYDAVANTITDLESSLRKSGRDEEKCLVIVMTDGGENSSVEYGLQSGGKEKLFKLIKSYEEKGNWTFVYLGANVDAYAEAAAIGIPQGNAAFYSSTAGSVAVASAGSSAGTFTLNYSDQNSTQSFFGDAGQTQDYRDDDDQKGDT